MDEIDHSNSCDLDIFEQMNRTPNRRRRMNLPSVREAKGETHLYHKHHPGRDAMQFGPPIFYSFEALTLPGARCNARWTTASASHRQSSPQPCLFGGLRLEGLQPRNQRRVLRASSSSLLCTHIVVIEYSISAPLVSYYRQNCISHIFEPQSLKQRGLDCIHDGRPRWFCFTALT
jgi:hypothetical protein